MDGLQPVVVAAVARDGAIGRGGALPWHLPEDLRHFRRVTEGHVLLMGRRTWASIGRPLPRRTSVVLSRRQRLPLPRGVLHARSLPEGLALAARLGDCAPRVIGGAVLYAEALPLAAELWITEVDLHVPDADCFFPKFDASLFDLVEERTCERDARLRFRRYRRAGSAP